MDLFLISGVVSLVSAVIVVGGLLGLWLDKNIAERKRQYIIAGAILGALWGLSVSTALFFSAPLPVPFSELPLNSQLFIITVISAGTWYAMVFMMWGTRKYIDFVEGLRHRFSNEMN